MNDDELRDRLARLDPLAHVPVTSVTSPRAQELLEQTMLTDPQTDTPSPTTRRWPLIASDRKSVV